MRERNISEWEVEQTLENYVISHTDPDGNQCYVGHLNGKRVEVVIARGSNPPLVITVMD